MSSNSYFFSSVSASRVTFTCKGSWTLFHAKDIERYLHASMKKNYSITFDCSNIEDFDTHGILCLLDFAKKSEKNGQNVSFENMSPKFSKLFEVCKQNYKVDLEVPPRENLFSHFFFQLGLFIFQSKRTLIDFFSFVGGVVDSLKILFIKPHKFRFEATLYHIQTSGLYALPIIFLTSFLIGIVIAFQGAVQLEKFGANIFIVEMVSISVARELAPLLTAIVVAGRSASSFTAQIGVMKITEEIDAMETMGFSPWQFLILPRIIGLMVSLPLLVLFADAVSIFGGMVVASASLGISFQEFMMRLQESVDLKHFIIGFVKAPIFGWIVAVIGCFRGFQISSSTESVGKYTTISVVNAIFWVIAMDAIISVFLTELGL